MRAKGEAMRIGLLTDVYTPVVNGVTNFIRLHKRELERRGHEVWVFTPGHTDYQDDEPRVVRSKAFPLSDTGYHLSFGYDRRTRRILREMDILHAQHPFLSGIIAAAFGQRYDIPVVFTNHTRYDLYAQQYLPLVPPSLSETFLETFFPAFTQRCDLVIAPSQGIYDLLRSWGTRCRIEIVPNGIDVEAFRQPVVRHRRAEVGIPEDARVAVFVGRMSGEKNVAFLLRAFAPVAQEVPYAHLLLIGGGPRLEEYRSLASELGVDARVHFTGQVPYKEIPGYLALADFFATASISEVHPLTVLEAIAAGLPVLGIHSPGIADSIEHGYNGLLAQEDPIAFALKMARLFQDDDLRERLGQGARESGERYSITRTTEHILELYQELIAAKRRSKRVFSLAPRLPSLQ